MRTLSGKKLILWALSLILCMTACAPAFASTGDRVLLHRSNVDGDSNLYIRTAFPYGNGVYVIAQEGGEDKVLRYADVNAEPEVFVLDQEKLRGEDGEDEEDEAEDAEEVKDAEDADDADDADDAGSSADGLLDAAALLGDTDDTDDVDDAKDAGNADGLLDGFGLLDDEDSGEEEAGEGYAYVNNWFIWHDELYGLTIKEQYSNGKNKVEVIPQHAKLENGEVILEEAAGLPEMDLSCLIVDEEEYQYTKGIDKIRPLDGKLAMTVYGEGAEVLEIIDMQEGTSTEIELGDDFSGEIAAGPDGSLIVTHTIWSDTDGTTTVKVNRLDLESREEETLMELAGLNDSRITPCYDPAKDTLYYILNGEVWAAPQFDAAQAVAVNDCQNTGDGMYLMPNGFLLISMYNSVELKNTDPAQRGSIRLRIRDQGWGNSMSETIYDINNTRGDISVVLQQDWNAKVLQEMMNRDSSVDIYVLQYDRNEFSAMRNRDYLPDLSGNEKIAANVERMYPYVQDALKQNGKIIAIPTGFTGETLGINMHIWKEIGGTEEELPKTWNQFFDWVEKMPERLDGRDVSLSESYTDRVYFRAEILQIMLNQYEAWMESKGDNSYAFASPMMCELLGRLNNLDYDALGIAEHQEEEDRDEEDGYLYNPDEEDKRPLLELYTSPVMNGGGDYEPLLLGFEEGAAPVIPVRICAAFVNPYSEHPQEAMEFLAMAMDNMEVYYSYSAYADKTEPVRDPYFEQNRKMFEKYIERLKKQIAKAEEDSEEKQALEESLKAEEEYIKQEEEHAWLVSAEMIENYRKWNAGYRVKGYSFFNDLFGEDPNDEDYNEFEKMFYSNEGAKMDPAELLGKLDQKVQMIRMERNY